LPFSPVLRVDKNAVEQVVTPDSTCALASALPVSSDVSRRTEAFMIHLNWQRFTRFLRLRETFRRHPCIYLQTDPEERVLRVGETDDPWGRYVGGTAYAIEAAMHGSGNLFFAALAPTDAMERK